MWHYVVIEIEKDISLTVPDKNPLSASGIKEDIQHIPCWNIVYKAPIEESDMLVSDLMQSDDVMNHEVAFKGCQVWIEQNKVEGSKYAIMKMFIV